jgi:hypothetical protein
MDLVKQRDMLIDDGHSHETPLEDIPRSTLYQIIDHDNAVVYNIVDKTKKVIKPDEAIVSAEVPCALQRIFLRPTMNPHALHGGFPHKAWGLRWKKRGEFRQAVTVDFIWMA